MQSSKLFRIILSIVSLIMISGGILLYRSLGRQLKYEKQNALAAIISLKTEEIVKWRKEHIRDAVIFTNDLPLNNHISLFLKNDKQVELKQELLLWMKTFIQNYDYESIVLLDNSNTVRLSFPPKDSLSYSLVAAALKDRVYNKIDFSDLHISDNSSGVEIDLVIPLLTNDSSHDAAKTKIGTIVLMINPGLTLFPLIQSWPTPSKSSETILLRREGDSVVFLNELRHQKNAALGLKLPMSNQSLPAAVAASGYEGLFEGRDYRDVEVISYLKKIPDSPWFMVAKVDKKELYSPLNELIFFISIIVFLVIFSISAMIRYYLRNQSIRVIKEKLESELKRKNAEEAYRSLYIRNEAILGAISNIIMEVDKNKIYKWANQAGYEFFGNDVIGKEAALYFEGEQDTYTSIEPLLTGACDKIYVESWQRRVDGEKRLLAWWCKSIKDENGDTSGVLSSAYDITEQKKDEIALKENEIRLRELNATKDKFFSIISHDLRSPFTSIMGFSELLIEKINEKDFRRAEEFATIINTSSQRTMDLLTNLTEWSRLQTGKRDCQRQETDIISIINEVALLLNVSALRKSVTIIRNTPLKLNIPVDYAMISTVLRNLISNSIKFSHPGSDVVISAVMHENEVRIEVRDHGVGIKKDIVDKLFRIETSFSTNGTHNEEGTGLGLILCKEFVVKHGGEIWVESEVGKGSLFTFTLPFNITIGES